MKSDRKDLKEISEGFRVIISKIIYHLVALIKKIFLKIVFGRHLNFGKGFNFRKGFTISIEGAGRINIGDSVFFNNYCSLNALESITIGDHCIFGENVKIYDHNHKFSDFRKPIMEQGYTSASVTIGKHCWIGSNVIILKGTTIGDNVVIGAGCLIYKDIPNKTIVKCKTELQIQEIIR